MVQPVERESVYPSSTCFLDPVTTCHVRSIESDPALIALESNAIVLGRTNPNHRDAHNVRTACPEFLATSALYKNLSSYWVKKQARLHRTTPGELCLQHCAARPGPCPGRKGNYECRALANL